MKKLAKKLQRHWVRRSRLRVSMSGGSSRGRYGDRMGMWNGPVNEHVTANLFVRAAFREADALHFEFAAMFKTRNLKIEPLVG